MRVFLSILLYLMPIVVAADSLTVSQRGLPILEAYSEEISVKGKCRQFKSGCNYSVQLMRLTFTANDKAPTSSLTTYIFLNDGWEANFFRVKGIGLEIKAVDFNDDGNEELLVIKKGKVMSWDLYQLDLSNFGQINYPSLVKLNKIPLESDIHAITIKPRGISVENLSFDENLNGAVKTDFYRFEDVFDFPKW